MAGGAHMEKRASRRYNRAATLMCGVFNANEHFPAEMVNYGKDGAQLVTRTPFSMGSVVVLRLKESQPTSLSPENCEGFRSVSLAEVKWCRKIHGADVSRYGMGVKYF